ncbi:MAG TPA: exodeoxyribonuclease VII small subunit [Candidatus Paceibacterota bacterium]|nr:exodeoxyribonuclease VII small subunit [Candidatus Paceibacterota bacterium]
MATKNNDIGESLKKLEAIASWFEKENEIDVEEGLKKVREGAALIKDLKSRLAEVTNEFEEIKKELTKDTE